MLASAIYEGSVRHCRKLPKVHAFDFRFFMLYLDLDEIKQVFQKRWFWSTRKWSLCRFRESEHLVHLPLDWTLRERCLRTLRDHGMQAPIGPIRLLTQLSYLGFSMNPVSFYYCYDSQGSRILAIIAEVNNTPWGEQHTYVIPSTTAKGTATIRSAAVPKDFHVSPFMGMNMNYRMAFSVPGSQLAVRIENYAGQPESTLPGDPDVTPGTRMFDVTMALRRRAISASALNWLLIKYPAISFQVFAGIYWHALRLAIKRIPFVPHPRARTESPGDGSVTTEDASCSSDPKCAAGSSTVESSH